MKVEVLASVMDQCPDAIAERMRLDSDAVIINQCDRLDYEEKAFGEHTLRFFSFPDRGVGRSRNEAILRARGDICLFSDQDIVYEPGYAEAIRKEFQSRPDADMILFNITIKEDRRTYHIAKRRRVRWYNCGRYGAVSFAVRRESLLALGVTFSLLFGGGARYSSGEDSLFLREFMKKGGRVYTAPVTIGREETEASTWFEGYNEKFFYDRGVLYRYLYGGMDWLIAIRFLLVHRKKLCAEAGFGQCLRWMRDGMRLRGQEEGDSWK